MREAHPKRLLVEGKYDTFVIAELIEHNGIPWPKPHPPVDIQQTGGRPQLLSRDGFSVELKSSEIQVLGLVIDADSSTSGTWESVRTMFQEFATGELPTECPDDGYIGDTRTGIRIGCWIMPDNRSEGMLETFLAFLVPPERQDIWEFAQASVAEAQLKGAPFIGAHTAKANVHTYLAWQAPPGEQLHRAIAARSLDPQHPAGQAFFSWFCKLFELQPTG